MNPSDSDGLPEAHLYLPESWGFFKLFNVTVFLGHLSNKTLHKQEKP
jgi:hypothetical protein